LQLRVFEAGQGMWVRIAERAGAAGGVSKIAAGRSVSRVGAAKRWRGLWAQPPVYLDPWVRGGALLTSREEHVI
jgi:hypothetical protein